MLPAGPTNQVIFHRTSQYMECILQGVKLAIFDKQLNVSEELNIDLPQHFVVILERIRSLVSIHIKAHSIISLVMIRSEFGGISFKATNHFISLGGTSHLRTLDIEANETLNTELPVLDTEVSQARSAFAHAISQQNADEILKSVELTNFAINQARWGRAMADCKPLPNDKDFFGLIKPQ